MKRAHFRLPAEDAHGDWLPSRVAHVSGAAWQGCPDLPSPDSGGLVISEIVGQGRRCVAFAARKYGQDLVLKVYHPHAAARHAHRCGGSIARYECERNAAFHTLPALAPFIAAPIGFSSSPRAELFLQERVSGEPLISFLCACSATCREEVLADLRTILERSHQAGLFDLDLHPSNIIVKRQADGTARPMLFDFNKVPYHVQPPNVIFGLLVKLGLIGRRSRDHRYWTRLSRIYQEP